jgi:hypothetical protein
MARRPTIEQIIAELLNRHQPIVYQSFIEAVAELRGNVVLSVFLERLERGDINAAIEALNIEPEAFSRVELAVLEAYNSGGQATVQTLPRLMDPEGQPIIFRWGVRNLPAEQAMREHAAAMVRGIAADAREGIREVLTEGLSQGQNPRETARDVVGRRSRANNMRVGGYLGLTQQQMQTVAKYRRAMEEGDVDAMRAYLTLSPNTRDRRFDRSILKAIREGRPVPAEIVQKAMTQYAERTLDLRGRVIARQETMVALAKSRDDAYQQQIDAGKLDAQEVTMTWRKTPREHPRLQHLAMDGQTVAYGSSFIAPDGTTLRYPMDPQAPVRHTLGCMCRVEYSVDFTAAALRRYRARTAA